MIALRNWLKRLEPTYDWGSVLWERMDLRGEAAARFFEIEWLGFRVQVMFGRTPHAGERGGEAS